ncbi:MAG: hypothetical protein SCJ94_06230 [Bacillota bacterium]|nr:hypothetical protein [Bacillota bacterium]MDW7729591.1 hypothetical protein [Bacillota bacterium]
MKKLVKNRLLLIVVLLIGLTVFLIGAPASFANEEAVTSEAYTPADKAAAIKAANDAISRIPHPRLIVAYEQAYIEEVARAFSLVAVAKEQYDAVDSDFEDLAHLYLAEQRVLKMLAIKDAQDAIDLIPPKDQITAEHRALIEEARRLVNIAMTEYGATAFEICWRYDKLKEAEAALPEEEEPEPEPEPKPKPDDRVPTPPTGGLSGLITIGAVLVGAGFLTVKKRRGKH